MKRLLGIGIAFAAATAVAQAPFTIVKPQEGANVRETVTIVFPKNSVPLGAFIGVAVDGKFIEATVPTLDQKLDALVYKLDTKARKIPDGKHTIKVNLYMNVDGKPAIADTSEVTVTVGNHAGIKVPEDGLPIRYKWRAGKANSYTVTLGMDVSTMTEAQNRMGGRAAQLPVAVETIRVLFAVDDVKPGGLGLVRAQLLPDKGKDYVVATVEDDTEPSIHYQEEFAPIWRLLSPTGREVYGDAPAYWIPEGKERVGASNQALYVLIPLPVLPEDPVKVGDSWQGQVGFAGSLEEAWNRGRVNTYQPARGTFVNVEWEQGRPCAHLRYEIEVIERSSDTEMLRVLGREFRGDNRFKMQQDVWITVDTGTLIRADLVLEADQRVAAPSGGGPGAGAAGGGSGGPALAGSSTAGGGRFASPPTPGQGTRSPGVAGGGSGPAGRGPGGGDTSRRAGGGGQNVFVRQKIYAKMLIEQ